MYAPFDKQTASVTDRIAWALCQIIDDDAPLRWTRYRFAAECIASNTEGVLDDLNQLATSKKPAAPASGGDDVRTKDVMRLQALRNESVTFGLHPSTCEALDRAISTLATRDGVWVPREPTEAMLKAADMTYDNWTDVGRDPLTNEGLVAIYETFIAAAPKGEVGK